MKQKTERLLKRGAAFLLALMLLVPGALLRPEQAYGKYHDTNLNTFVHPMPETSEGTAGEMMQIKMRIGYYNDTHGFYAPQTDYITDVHVRLSNDETYLLIKNENGNIVDDTGEDQTFAEFLEEYMQETNKTHVTNAEKERIEKIWEAGRAQGQNDGAAGYGKVYYAVPVETGSYPLEVNEELFTQDVYFDKLMKGEMREATFNVKVRHDIEEGYYAIPVTVYYNIPPRKDADYKGSAHTEYINIYLTKEGTEIKEPQSVTTEDKQFVLGEGQSTPVGTYPNVMNYSIRMRNQKKKVYDLTVHMETSLGDRKAIVTHPGISTANSSDFPFEINEANYDRSYETVDTGEVIEVPYSMAIKRVTTSAYYPLSYTLTFRTEPEGDLYKETYSYYIKINNPAMDDPKAEEEKTSQEWNANTATKARLIVDSYRLEPEKVYAGDTFALVLDLKNASEDISATNILLTFVSETTEDKSAIFATDNGANSVVINSLPAGSTTQVRMIYTAKAGVDQGSYKITIKEKYDSPEYKNAEEEVSVDVPVYQYARLSTSSFEVMPSSLEVGSESNVMFGINNTGKVTLYNVSVKFTADSIKENNAYIGNIKPGSTGNVDVMLSAIAATTDDGTVKAEISYEDEYGNVSTETKEFELFVTEAMEDMGMDGMYDPSMMGEMPEDEGGIMDLLQKNLVAVIGGAVAAVLLAVFGIRRYRKKKLEKETMTDDEI